MEIKKDDTAAKAAAADMAEEVGGAATVADPPETVEVRGETFHLAQEVSAFLRSRAACVIGAKDPDLIRVAEIQERLLMASITPEDRERFETLLLDAEPPIGDQEYAEIAERVIGAVMGRPTPPPSA